MAFTQDCINILRELIERFTDNVDNMSFDTDPVSTPEMKTMAESVRLGAVARSEELRITPLCYRESRKMNHNLKWHVVFGSLDL